MARGTGGCANAARLATAAARPARFGPAHIIDAGALHPPRSPIRTPAGAATGRGRRAPGRAGGMGLRAALCHPTLGIRKYPPRTRATGVQAAHQRPGEVAAPGVWIG